MYHGNGDSLVLHRGLCLTDAPHSAASYARAEAVNGETPMLHTIELDGSMVTIERLAGWDRYENTAPGDAGEQHLDEYGNPVDVLIFTDEDWDGIQHRTYRLMTDDALAAVTVVESRPIETGDTE